MCSFYIVLVFWASFWISSLLFVLLFCFIVSQQSLCFASYCDYFAFFWTFCISLCSFCLILVISLLFLVIVLLISPWLVGPQRRSWDHILLLTWEPSSLVFPPLLHLFVSLPVKASHIAFYSCSSLHPSIVSSASFLNTIKAHNRLHFLTALKQRWA